MARLDRDVFRTPDYFWFSPDNLEFKGFHLLDGRYQELEPNANGWLWSQQLELYLGIHDSRVRFFTAEGQLIPTPEEMAQQERQQKEQAKQQVAEMQALLVRYRERFGELPE